jgi:hypothetical protein
MNKLVYIYVLNEFVIIIDQKTCRSYGEQDSRIVYVQGDHIHVHTRIYLMIYHENVRVKRTGKKYLISRFDTLFRGICLGCNREEV